MRHPFTWLAAAVLTSVAAAACTSVAESPAPTESYRGTIGSGCAPWDAPSTALELEAVEGDAIVSFNLWPSAGIEVPATVMFDEAHPIGQGAYCASPGSCAPSQEGKVVLRESSAGGIEGEWTLVLEDGTRLEGTFLADWRPFHVACG